MRKRIFSALVLVLLALGAAWAGRPYWDLLVVALGGFMTWEWARLCGGGRISSAGYVLIASVLATLLTAELAGFAAALAVLAVAALAVAAVACRHPSGFAIWHGLGTLYVGLPCLALNWTRSIPDDGLTTLLWVLGLVWATDTAAYFAGRAIGGPKLTPRISPNKTWAGLAGGVVAAAGVGLVFAVVTTIVTPWLFVLISASLALVEQVGDLFESSVKRHFGVKDSGGLIPGHGGVLDRADGLIAVAIAVVVLTLLAGQTPLTW